MFASFRADQHLQTIDHIEDTGQQARLERLQSLYEHWPAILPRHPGQALKLRGTKKKSWATAADVMYRSEQSGLTEWSAMLGGQPMAVKWPDGSKKRCSARRLQIEYLASFFERGSTPELGNACSGGCRHGDRKVRRGRCWAGMGCAWQRAVLPGGQSTLWPVQEAGERGLSGFKPFQPSPGQHPAVVGAPCRRAWL